VLQSGNGDEEAVEVHMNDVALGFGHGVLFDYHTIIW